MSALRLCNLDARGRSMARFAAGGREGANRAFSVSDILYPMESLWQTKLAIHHGRLRSHGDGQPKGSGSLRINFICSKTWRTAPTCKSMAPRAAPKVFVMMSVIPEPRLGM